MLKCLGGVLLIVTGLASLAWAQGPTRFDGEYMGELTLKKVIAGDCTRPPLGAVYPLTISNGDIRFLYTPHFSTTLRGRIDENGVFKASARLHHGFATMEGRIQGNNVNAYIVSPSCNYTFRTKN
jgi:hypothetical protein